FHLLSFYLFFFFHSSPPHPFLHSFPTRRSSDLPQLRQVNVLGRAPRVPRRQHDREPPACPVGDVLDALAGGHVDPLHVVHHGEQDRKSTRLNSSHVAISYAVFCLKKKKKNTNKT